MVCKKCRNEIQEGEKFCGKCGNKIDNIEKEESKVVNTEKETTEKVNSKNNKNSRFKFFIIIIIIICVISIGNIYYNNTSINDTYLTKKYINISQSNNVKVKILNIANINYKDFNKIVFAKFIYENQNNNLSGLMLVNKKEDKVECVTINSTMLWLLSGIAESEPEKVKDINNTIAEYIQNYGTESVNDLSSDNFKSLMKKYADIIGNEKCKNYIKTAFSRYSNTTLNYTILFEKGTPIIKYIAFYEDTIQYNTNYPIDERTYKYLSKDYSNKKTLNAFEYAYGPAYKTVQQYSLYPINSFYKTAQEFENSKIGSYSSLDKPKEKFNVEE